jgi:hypothetical protein
LYTFSGQGWALSGGEAAFLNRGNTLHVNGVQNVIRILEEIERGEHSDIRYFELNACLEGCVGGCLTVTNPFVAKNRIAIQMEKMKSVNPEGILTMDEVRREYNSGRLSKEHSASQPMGKLSEDEMELVIGRLASIDEIYARLPKFDCGSCGSPGCKAMAEDIVAGNATEMDCVFMLKDAIARLTKNMLEISTKVMPIMSIDESSKGEA